MNEKKSQWRGGSIIKKDKSLLDRIFKQLFIQHFLVQKYLHSRGDSKVVDSGSIDSGECKFVINE
jgi:hypothetical protein